MALNLHIGQHINAVRERKNIKLSLLAKMVGASKSHLSEIENKEKFPSLELMRKIAKALDDGELLHTYIRKRFPEVNQAYQEAALYSEANRIFKGNVISQILSEKAMEALLSKKDTKKLAAEALKVIFMTRPYDKALEERLERVLAEFKSTVQAITKSY